MSKSKGNVINPLDLVDKYGADALRMALMMSTTAGHDSAVGESKVRGMRNFSNKIWNAARYVLMARDQKRSNVSESYEDKEFLKRLGGVAVKVTDEMERLKLGIAAETVHNEFWHWFCDECIEDHKARKLSQEAIESGLKTFMILIHPFMPYVTEAVWQELGFGSEEDLLISTNWPKI